MVTTVFHTRGGHLDGGDQPLFEAFRNRIASSPTSPRILVHLHGGLVDEKAAETIARRLSGRGTDGYRAPDDWEQVYVVWRTGAFETLKENWRDLAINDRLYNVLLKRLISFASGRLQTAAIDGRGAMRGRRLTIWDVKRRLGSGDDAPFADIDRVTSSPAGGSRADDVDDGAEADLKTELDTDTDLEEAAYDVEAFLAQGRPVARSTMQGDPAIGAGIHRRLDASIQSELHGEAEAATSRGVFAGEVARKIVKHGVSIGLRVLRRYRIGRDHGLQATVAEEIARELYGDLIGSVVWGMMKGDASDHFEEGAFGAQLGQALAAGGQNRPQAMVVGHSAGSIFATELLMWAATSAVPLTLDLVFLAPAVRTLRFAEAIDKAEQRIARFRSFVMTDDKERADVLLGKGFGFIYPSSLLYLVSGLFEEHASEGLSDAPLLGMARFLDPQSGWLQDQEEGAALARVQKFLGDAKDRTVRSIVAGGKGLSSSAISHGGFDDDPETLSSVIAMLSEPR